ncbi:Ig-like protein group 2 [Herbinix hemicellulosilytica]|uniref:BIG2 domain-containing protein n=1 Tax=Herbinix hemicellulosilytica TaxID=1564487 RepID=A0A0H5SEZ6_HERHM|nr:Ig-like domain-containing protein [Herbinix hemicellulosilytica]RBP57737.1 Ig-like protein group 2 [Herbinix hemicellulosilytica]CRZ33431.1 hypothetical protein HHT355_0219 [Herbinix hemicellulosilytica]
MKKKFLCKYMVFLCLIFCFLFLPCILPVSENIAKASETEKEKNDYRLNLRSVTLVNGKSFNLKVYNIENDAKVTYKSANPEIASVNDDGTVTAHKVGVTTITATVKRGTNSTSLTCDITVGPPAFSIKMTRSMIILGLEQNDLLEVIMKPSNTAELAKFSSYDPSIVSVSSGGRITAKKIGMTYIFAEIDATTSEGYRKFDTCKVIVCNPDDVSLLKNYFATHPELSLVSESGLSNALYEFFNNLQPADGSMEIPKGDALIGALDKYLNEKLNLTEAKKKYDEMMQLIKEAQSQ